MRKIRKGSIVFHTREQEFMKALTSSERGELTDELTQKTGLLRYPSFKGYVLCESNEPTGRKYKNKFVRLTKAHMLIPRKEYLQQRVEAISLGQGESNNPYIN